MPDGFAVECEKCGHLNYKYTMVAVCQHCDSREVTGTNDFYPGAWLCADCQRILQLMHNKHRKWVDQFVRHDGGEIEKEEVLKND